MSEHKEPIPSRIYNAAVDGHVAGAEDIFDDALGKEQSVINQEQTVINQEFDELKESVGENNGIATLGGNGKITQSQMPFNIDEEDVTNKEGLIKFKDKDYDPTLASGMGRVYLRKNPTQTWAPWLSYRNNGVVYLMYCNNDNTLYGIYNSNTGKGIVLNNNLVSEQNGYVTTNLPSEAQGHYLNYTESGGVYTITLPDNTTITSTELNQTRIYRYEDGGFAEINMLTQSMLDKAKTIYHIQYDYDLNGQSITVPDDCVLEFDGGSLSNGILTNWKIDVIHYSWFKNINDAIANSVENEAVLDGDFKTVTVTSPIVVNFEKIFFKIKNFNFVWGATKDYTDNPTNYPTKSNPNILSQSILYFSNLIYYSEIVNCSFNNAMFAITFYWPHNSPNIINCHFTNTDCCIFCYAGCQNYNIRGCRAEYIGCFFASSATCFENTNPDYRQFNDNYFTDGLCIKDSDKGNTVFYHGIDKNQSFDVWFRNNILKPTQKTYTANNAGKYYGLNVYESWKEGLTPETIASMLANNIPAVSANDIDISGHVMYIPFRNRRTVGALGMEAFFDYRGRGTNNDIIYVGYNIRKGLFRLILENTPANDYNYIVTAGIFQDCQIYTCDSSRAGGASKIIGAKGDGTRYSGGQYVYNKQAIEEKGSEVIFENSITYDSGSIIRADNINQRRLYTYSDNRSVNFTNKYLEPSSYMLNITNGLNGHSVRAIQRSMVTEFLYPDLVDENGKMIKTVLLTAGNIEFTKAAISTDKIIEVKFNSSGILAVPNIISNIGCNVERYEYINGQNNYRLYLRNEIGVDKSVGSTITIASYRVLYIDYRCYVFSNSAKDYIFTSLYENNDVIITSRTTYESLPESVVTTALMNSIYTSTLNGFKCFNTTDGKHYERRADGWYSDDFGDDNITNKSTGSKKIIDNAEFCYNGNSWVYASGTFTEGVVLSSAIDVIELFKEDISDVSNSFGTHFIVTMNKRAYGIPKEVDIVSVTCDKYRNQYGIDVKSFNPSALKYGYFIDSNNIFHVYLAKNTTLAFANNQIFFTRIGGKKVNFTFNIHPENISDINFTIPEIVKINKVITALTSNTVGQYEGEQAFVQNINKPVWWNGTVWVDATGTPV